MTPAVLSFQRPRGALLVAACLLIMVWPRLAVAMPAELTSAGRTPGAAASPRRPPAPASPTDTPDDRARAEDDAAAPARPRPDQPAPGASPVGAAVLPRYVVEAVTVRGNRRTRSGVVLRFVPIKPGDVIDTRRDNLQLIRYRLLGTGYFQEVSIGLERGTQRGHVRVVVRVVERNTIVVNDLLLGLSADADTDGRARPLTAYAGVDLAETNLLGTGILVGTAVGFAQDQLALRLRYFDPAVFGSRWLSRGSLLYNSARDFFGNASVLYDDRSNTGVPRFAVVDLRRFGGTLGIGRDLGITTRGFVDYRLEAIDAGVPRTASHVRGGVREPLTFDIMPGRSLLSSVRAEIQTDTRDQPILTTNGFLGHVRAELGLAPLGSDYAFQRFEGRLARWWPTTAGQSVKLEVFAGAITGDVPFFDRYYVGDFSDFVASRILGLNFDRRPPPNFLDTTVAEVRRGRYAAKISGEYRVPLYRGHRSVYGIDLYGSLGIYALADDAELERPLDGYDGLRRIPMDLTGNLGLRMDTAAGGFTLALSNIVAFVPLRREAE